MKKIDEDLYSRQIFTYGKEIMDKIVSLKILIIGLRGLGIEIAKNVILSGPKEVSISDKTLCKINDLGSNFYIEENDINKKTREEACVKKLKSLNPYVNVNIHAEENADRLSSLAQLPDSCVASADYLQRQRKAFEEYGVFSPAMIDGIIEQLRAFDDKNLRKTIEGYPEEIQKLVNQYFHCG